MLADNYISSSYGMLKDKWSQIIQFIVHLAIDDVTCLLSAT